MRTTRLMPRLGRIAAVFAAALATSSAHADPTAEWNRRAVDALVAAQSSNEAMHRVLAMAHTAAYEAAQALGARASRPGLEAALASAHCRTLAALLPAQQAATDTACTTVLDAMAAGPEKDTGVAAGERAARDVLARRADDGAAAPETYRPFTVAGRYVPTTIPASPQWGQRKPWLMSSAAQFRPSAPPALTSERWARDFTEVKTLGSSRSTTRSAEQTDVARFWGVQQAATYYSLIRSVADRPDRELLRNVRLFATAAQALDDASIALYDAKYHHAFWRPITAIRNADLDGNDATERDAGWSPLLPTPLHPEYPCAACIQAAAVGAVLTAELGAGPLDPPLVAHSQAVKGATRRWPTVDAFVREIGDARTQAGLHYRFSNEAAFEMGRAIGELSVRRFGAP